jgi:hypothetical protein
MKTSANLTESDKCRHLASQMRQDAIRATLCGLSERLIRGAEDLEIHAAKLAMQVSRVVALRH